MRGNESDMSTVNGQEDPGMWIVVVPGVRLSTEVITDMEAVDGIVGALDVLAAPHEERAKCMTGVLVDS